MVKRAVDIAFAGIGLVILLPVFIAVSALIRLDSPGPVFYLQARVGRNFETFKLFKFRSMYRNADKRQAITIGMRDVRITKIGYYLRKFKLDELPQLINVLRGDMSLVGPRPELKKFVDLYTAEQSKVLSVRPGITDLASLEFRNENTLLEGKKDPIQFYIDEIMPAKLELGLKYIQSRSLRLDLLIIFRTVFSIFKN